MKRVFVGIVSALIIVSCDRHEMGADFQKGGRLYQFATVLADKLPALDPAENQVLAGCRYFSIRVDSFLLEMYLQSGNHLFDWAGLDSAQLYRTVTARLQRMLEKRLLLAAARTAPINYSTAELDTAVERLVRQNGGSHLFHQRLERDGLTFEQVKSRLAEEIVLHKFERSLAEEMVPVTDQEVEELYQQEKTATFHYIFISQRSGSETERVQKLTELNAKIKAFVDFSKLARRYSEDAETRHKGGLYERIPRGYLPAALDRIVFTAPIGVVQHTTTGEGDHYLLIVRREKESRPLAQVWSELYEGLVTQKKRKQVQDVKSRLIQEAQINMTLKPEGFNE